MNSRLLSALALAVLPFVARADDPILASRQMYVQFLSPNNEGEKYESRVVRILDREGRDKGEGKLLSANARLIGEWPLYPGVRQWFTDRVLPTGGEGQAVALPAAGNFNGAKGTITFWVKGKDWDVNSPQVEELLTLECPTGNIVFAKTAPKTLSLTPTISVPMDFDPERLHMFAITYDGKAAQIYVDGAPKLKDGTPFPMPAGVTQIVLGQRTPGGKENKWLDTLATYDRPLLLSEINRLVNDEGRLTGRKQMAVIQTGRPPKIDGTMDAGEWDDAAEITGLIHVKSGGGAVSLYNFWGPADVASDQSTFWVTYDDQYLYVAHHSPPPARIADQINLIVAMLKSSISLHDANVDQDDGIRLSLLKPYPNGDEYKIYINGIGTTYEFNSSYEAPGSRIQGITLGWDPKLMQKSLLTKDGWTIEVALPWSDFYFGKPADGTELHMNFCRLWRQVINESHAWCYGERDYKDDTLLALPGGEVLFQGSQGVVVRLHGMGQVRQGKLNVKADLVNRTKADQSLRVKINTNSGEVSHEEIVAVPAGQSVPFQFARKIVDFRTREAQFTVADAGNGTAYHVTTLPVLRKDRPDIYVRKYPSSEKIKFEANLEFLGQHDPKDIGVQIAIRHKETGKTAFRQKSAKLAAYHPDFLVSTTNWPVGTYDAQFTLTAPGMKPYPATVAYQRAPLPGWWNNDIGKELGVPYPWTAMECTNDYIQVWGRQYQFNKKLLPANILTTGYKGWAPVIRSPIRLVVKSDKGEILDSDETDADVQWTKAMPTRVEGVRTIAAKGFSIQNELWSEYDGLIWCRLTIIPHCAVAAVYDRRRDAGQPGDGGHRPPLQRGKITLTSMELEFPLKKEFTDVINAYDYSLRGTGKLKPEGFVSPNTPIWLGNGDGGLQWFCETDGWFFLKDSKQMLRVENRPEGATLRAVMIDVPTEFDKPHVIEFGFIATPVRPKVYRTVNDPDLWQFRGGPGPWYPQGQELLPAPDYWPAPSGWRNISADPVPKMWMQNIYIVTAGINTRTEDFAHFGDEWLANEMPSVNPWAGAGYQRRDGSIAVTYPILGARDICKRLYNMVITYYPFAWVGMHQSGMTCMAYHGFANHFWDGENFNSAINDKQPTYRGIMNPALYRAEYMGHNFGSQVMFLGQARIRDETVDREGADTIVDLLHGLMLLHDTEVSGWQLTHEREKVCERTYNAIKKHWLHQPGAYRFVPYWHQDFVQLPSKDMYCSAYLLDRETVAKLNEWKFHVATQASTNVPKKAVLIVYNDFDWQGELRLKPDWKKLGFDTLDNLTVENAVHSTGFRIEKTKNDKGEEVEKGVFFPKPEETAKIENGELVFPMTKFNYRFIAITQPQ